MLEVNTAGPQWQPTSKYYDCRFAVLRQPLGFSRGAEILSDDYNALHSWVEIGGVVVSVGRSHLIPSDSDGSQADHAGPGAAKCPAFGSIGDAGNRPAIQIRQMGTLPPYHRQGHAARVLSALEKASVEHFGATTGFLQARQNAIPFYQSQGWSIIDEPYDIKGIGPHRSMMKRLV